MARKKPVECMRRPMVNNSRPGQLVYDPFLGSGTSLIAAEMTGRVCCGLEISLQLCRCHSAALASLHRTHSDARSLGSASLSEAAVSRREPTPHDGRGFPLV
jgi:hypothetical protein